MGRTATRAWRDSSLCPRLVILLGSADGKRDSYSNTVGKGNCSVSSQSRKPYTITKQRERWTDSEHELFLEALKLYGRAWRSIQGNARSDGQENIPAFEPPCGRH